MGAPFDELKMVVGREEAIVIHDKFSENGDIFALHPDVLQTSV